MTEYTRELMYGKRPVHRTNPQPGQSEWYYLDPRGTDRFADMKQIDVPSEDSPNPYANEIQNYLYENDEYNYKQLYGDNPPPPVQTQQRGIFEQFGDDLRNIARKNGIDKLTENCYNLGYDAAERLTYPQNNVQDYENKSSLAQAQAEAQRLTPINVSDVNKHQYVSCVGAFDGPISVGATTTAGLYKEYDDLRKKWNDPKYGSNWQILQDNFKDLGNDALGIFRGWLANDINACNYLLPPNARRR